MIFDVMETAWKVVW